MRKEPRKPLTKKQKVGFGVGIPLGMVVIAVLPFVILHFTSVSKNNATSVPGSNPGDHQIIQDLTEEEINNNENGGDHKSDTDYEDSKPSDNADSNEQAKNDKDYNVDTDSDDIVYKKAQQTAQKNKESQNHVQNSYYDRYKKNYVKGIGSYNRNNNNGGRTK